MTNAPLTVSLPRMMRDFIEAQLREGTFSTPSEYIRSLTRLDQQHASRRAFEALVRAAEICRSWMMKIGVQFKLSSLSAQPPNRNTAAPRAGAIEKVGDEAGQQ
jgi:putative addiction module CopG family antidote